MRIKDSLYLWLIPLNLEKLPNTELEKKYAKNYNLKIAERFLYSRSYIRNSLSYLFDIDSIDIPLKGLPQQPPLFLDKKLGFLSISHCKEFILLGWSINPIGVDIEFTDRIISEKLLVDKYFFDSREFLTNKDGETIKSKIIDYWVIKEATIKLNRGNLFLEAKEWVYNEKMMKSINKNNGNEIDAISFKIDSLTIGVANKNVSSRDSLLICKY